MGIITPELEELAREAGVMTAYRDVEGNPRHPSPEALLAVLGQLGHPVDSPSDIPKILRGIRAEKWTRPLQPVYVLWEGKPHSLFFRITEAAGDRRIPFFLETESGEKETWVLDGEALHAPRSQKVGSQVYLEKEFRISRRLPRGYHRLEMELDGRRFGTWLIVAPTRAFALGEKAWGLFAPLYALRSERDWGIGDLADLERLMEISAGHGAGFVATLPALSSFFRNSGEVSPYRPVSRLFWNELFLDPESIPGFAESSEARAWAASRDFQDELLRLKKSPRVDYAAVENIKRRLLEICRKEIQGGESRLQAEWKDFEEERSELARYAAFRAAQETTGRSWRLWPEEWKRGVLPETFHHSPEARLHRFAQWANHRQWVRLKDHASRLGQRLLLDFPLGVHPDGFDTWRFAEEFVEGISMGAPPDPFFQGGQNWSSPPLHPQRIRERGYEYFRKCIQHHLEIAQVLRLDHVMGFHRLYWIPAGFPATDGVYVRYAAEEFYAILCLESQRRQAPLAGEDLGTVPEEVRPAMSRHSLLRTWVPQFERDPAQEPPADSAAALNTHDMPPFAAQWEGRPEAEAGLEQALLKLAASAATLLTINMEDLWLETEPQNVPGTGEERENWRRRMRLGLEEFSADPRIQNLLTQIGRVRGPKSQAR